MAVVGRANIFLGADTASFTSKMDRARRDMSSNATRMNRSLAKVDRAFKNVGRAASRFAKGMVSLRGAAVLTAGVVGLGLLVKKSLDTADAIAKTADAIGITTDALQKYRFALDISGVAMAQTDKGLKKFVRNMGELARSSSETQTSLKDLDPILLKNLRSLQTVEDQVAAGFRALASYTSQSKRAAVAQALFGRSGVDMTVAVKKGIVAFEGLQKRAESLGIVIEEKLLRNAENAKDQLTILAKVIGTNVTAAVLKAAPQIAELAQRFADAIPKIISMTAAFLEFVGVLETSRLQTMREDLAGVTAEIKNLNAELETPLGPRTEGPVFERLEALLDQRAVLEARMRALTSPATSKAADTTETIAEVGRQSGIAAEKVAGLTDKVRQLGAARKKWERVQVEVITRMRDENEILGLLAAGRKEEATRLERLQEAFGVLNDIKQAGGRIDDDTLGRILQELDARDKLTKKIDENVEAEKKAQDAADESIRKAEQRAEAQQRLIEQPFLNAIEGIQRAFTDGFEKIFSGGVSSFSDLADTIKSIFIRLAAEIATLLVFRPVLGGILSSIGLAGIGQSLGVSGGGLNILGGLGNLSSLGGPGGILSPFNTGINGLGSAINNFGTSFGFSGFTGGVTAGFDAGGFISAGGQFGPSGANLFGSATLSGALGAAGLGALAGSFLGPLLGLNQTGSSIGGGLGAGLGFAVGGPIGGVIGGLLGGLGGGLFGPGESVGPNATASFGVSGGRISILDARADNGGDVSRAIALAESVMAALNSIADLADLTFQGQHAGAVGFEQEGFFSLTSGGRKHFDTAEQAGADFVARALADGGFSGELAGVVRRSAQLGSSLEQLASDVLLARSIMSQTEEMGSALTQALDAINQKYDEQIKRARLLGLATDGLARAREAELSLVNIQARAPFTAAAAQIVDFINAQRLGGTSTLSPTDRLTEAQRQFGTVLSQVSTGRFDLTGSLQASAQTLLNIGRENFASTVNFANLESNVISSLLAISENFTDGGFVDQQIEAQRQGTSAIVTAEQATTAAVDRLGREIQLLRQQLVA